MFIKLTNVFVWIFLKALLKNPKRLESRYDFTIVTFVLQICVSNDVSNRCIDKLILLNIVEYNHSESLSER